MPQRVRHHDPRIEACGLHDLGERLVHGVYGTAILSRAREYPAVLILGHLPLFGDDLCDVAGQGLLPPMPALNLDLQPAAARVEILEPGYELAVSQGCEGV